MKHLAKGNPADKEYRDINKCWWNLITEKGMLERYPSGGFKIIGDLIHRHNKGDEYIAQDGQTHAIQEYSGQTGKGRYVCGYIELEEKDCFVRVLRRKRSPLLGLLALLAFLAAIFFAGLWLGQKEEKPYLDETAIAYNIEGFENKDPEQLMLPGIEEIRVAENETKVEYALFNPKGNMCNIQYIIKLTDSGETIYSSNQVSPGYAITEFDLNRTFEKGEYPITVEMRTYDIGDGETKYNSGVMDAKLIVE